MHEDNPLDPSASPSLPVVTVLHGDDEFAMLRFVEAQYRNLGDPSIADLNFTRLEGSQAGEEDIQKASSTMPFLAPRRLVAIHNPLARLKDRSSQERFLRFLDSLPDTACLLLLIEDHRKKKKIGGDWINSWEVLRKDARDGKLHWLAQWASQASPRARICEFPLPEQREMPAWIQEFARQQGGQFSPQAAQVLAQQVENNTRIAAQEINKLLTFVALERTVEAEDVERLTSASQTLSVFDLVDALSQNTTDKPLGLLNRLLEQSEPEMLFAMIVRQFRLLLQVREVLDEGGDAAQVIHEVGEVRLEFIARKLINQARPYSLKRLENIYHQLGEIDQAIKTGQVPAALAMEMFIADLQKS